MSYLAMREKVGDCLEFCIKHGQQDDLDHVPLYVLAALCDWRGRSRMVKRRLQYYSLARLKAGDCWYWSEKQRRTVRVQVGQVIAVGPGLTHAYGGHGRSYVEDYVIFFGPVADALRKLGMFAPDRPFISLRDPERIGEIADIIRQGTVESQLRAGMILQQMLIDARFDTAHQASSRYPVIHKLLEKIARTPAVHFSNQEMASFCGMSISYFRKVFRKEIGMAPIRYCERLRMNLACEQLANTQLRVGETARRLGYSDPLYFSQRFSRVIGVSPVAYRRSVELGREEDH